MPNTPPHNVPERFLNRELSWLAFNRRVVEEAEDSRHPLLERVRFLSIAAANLDEFFTVRVASLHAQEAGGSGPGDDGLTPARQLAAIRQEAPGLFAVQQNAWRVLRQEMADHRIPLLKTCELDASDLAHLEEHFMTEIYPLLTPVAVDPAHPFPFVANGHLALALLLHDPRMNKDIHAMVVMPRGVPRFLRLPRPDGEAGFVMLERTVQHFLPNLFPGFTVRESGFFRVLRDSEIDVQDDIQDQDNEDLTQSFERALRRRARGRVVLLTVNASMPEPLRGFLIERLDAAHEDVLLQHGLQGLADARQLIVADERPDLVFRPHQPHSNAVIQGFTQDAFATLRQGDLLLHHPYESFDLVINFLRQAAEDPFVLSIRQTLYRTGDDSPVVQALIAAAQNGKSVTAMVELKARFDEEANIHWARSLENAGVQVVYGFVSMKTHAKITLVVRREEGLLRSYAHFGTGNYHIGTARSYADLSFLTCDPELMADAMQMFNYMTGTAIPQPLRKASLAPLTLRTRLVELIEAEAQAARAGQPCGIWAKMNALVDPDIIDCLYRASQAGVPIELMIRGLCCLRPGVPGLSPTIRVSSMVGRFLEHSRILAFGHGHALPSPHALVFLSSADWMQRNFDRRVETLIPITHPDLHQRILREILTANLRDQRQTWLLHADGGYRKQAREGFCAHAHFLTGGGDATTD
ncbi:MAG: RNA degradosome polyphosphate kinase [Alphaproteobacteria bacterium]|nr:MAG: RNA degradosome polyphosphate kinase [Alphaproteobacteria bacterium]